MISYSVSRFPSQSNLAFLSGDPRHIQNIFKVCLPLVASECLHCAFTHLIPGEHPVTDAVRVKCLGDRIPMGLRLSFPIFNYVEQLGRLNFHHRGLIQFGTQQTSSNSFLYQCALLTTICCLPVTFPVLFKKIPSCFSEVCLA